MRTTHQLSCEDSLQVGSIFFNEITMRNNSIAYPQRLSQECLQKGLILKGCPKKGRNLNICFAYTCSSYLHGIVGKKSQYPDKDIALLFSYLSIHSVFGGFSFMAWGEIYEPEASWSPGVLVIQDPNWDKKKNHDYDCLTENYRKKKSNCKVHDILNECESWKHERNNNQTPNTNTSYNLSIEYLH